MIYLNLNTSTLFSFFYSKAAPFCFFALNTLICKGFEGDNKLSIGLNPTGESNISSPTSFKYIDANIVLETSANGSSISPTIEWNGNSTPVVKWNGDRGTFSLENPSDAFFGIDAVSGRVTWNKGLKAGTHTLTVIAQNKVGAIKTRIVVTKQPKPVFPPSNFSNPTNNVNVLIHESGSSPAPLISWNGDQGTFALEEDTDAKITIDATTGIITWMSNLSPGTYTLNVTAKNSAGSIVATFTLIVGGPDISEKGEFKLYQNYPNPTDGVTYFVYNLTQSSWVRIDVFDSNGRLARNIMVDRKHEKGRHILKLNTLGYPSGVYLLRIYSAKEGHQAIKFMVVR